MKGRECFDGAVNGGRVESGLEMGAGYTGGANSASWNRNLLFGGRPVPAFVSCIWSFLYQVLENPVSFSNYTHAGVGFNDYGNMGLVSLSALKMDAVIFSET